MIAWRDLHRFGIDIVMVTTVTEVGIRRSISAFYYGLFHRLTAEGASSFQGGGAGLTILAARAFDHSAMKKVCETLVRSAKGQPPPYYGKLGFGAPDSRLVAVADAFVRLQVARHSADYDLSLPFTRADGLEFMQRADFAHWKLDELSGKAETTAFLAALLLADRWKRGG